MKTRDQDIHVLKEAYKRGTPAERKMADYSLTKIYRETNGRVIETRKKLIDATRGGDHKAMTRYNNELLKMRNGR